MHPVKHKTKTFAIYAALIVCATIVIVCWAFERRYKGRVYPHVSIDTISFSGQTPEEVKTYWLTRNTVFSSTQLELSYDGAIATISGTDLDLGYDATLSATQAYLVGRSPSRISNVVTKLTQTNVNLQPYFRWNTDRIRTALDTIGKHVDAPADEALFQFENGKVKAFRPSKEGRRLNRTEAEKRIYEAFFSAAKTGSQRLTVLIPIEAVYPSITTDRANTFGIKQLIGTGYSEFSGSIAGRIHNVRLAASLLNGILIKPGETFSFNDAIGDISAATGYQSAYIIKEGRTVLGDGGGVCQVSTTLFRAALAAGLPIVERHPHAYRVHYYEEGWYKPGLDATVFGPTYDLKFTNDTPGYILIQTKINLSVPSLTFLLYGTSDGRVSYITNQKLWDVAPPPPDLYQDDPTLPKGTVKQVDFAAWGAKASFDYSVIRAGETLQKKTFSSTYRPWQAVYLKGAL